MREVASSRPPRTSSKKVTEHPLSSPQKRQQHPVVVSPSQYKDSGDEKKEDPPSLNHQDHPLAVSGNNGYSNTSRIPQYHQPNNTMATKANGSTSTSTTTASSMQLSAADALAMRREGAEATIVRLRHALNQSSEQQAASQTALAKSDAVILELRSSVRQLKRQVAQAQKQGEASESTDQTGPMQPGSFPSVPPANDANVGELQLQLDRAQAQLLTADMVRKELEDTLEAEQYTWELRVQDQERQIDQLQSECSTLLEDLEVCRSQWKEAEDGWTRQVQELQVALEQAQDEIRQWKSGQQNSKNDSSKSNNNNAQVEELESKLAKVQTERAELQACLDEALKELEAVDAELQGGGQAELQAENQRLRQEIKEQEKQAATTETLEQLHRFVLERAGLQDRLPAKARPRSAQELSDAIRTHLDRTASPSTTDSDMAATRQQVKDLESQLSVYRGDLQAREESANELRASLKEAVALLKPLQDAVAAAEEEKAALRRQLLEDERRLREEEDNKSVATETQRQAVEQLRRELDSKQREIDSLHQQVDELERELNDAKKMAASSVVAAHHSEALTSPRAQAKRAQEDKLRQMFKDTQSRLSLLHEQNAEAEAKNKDLQGRLHQAEALGMKMTVDPEKHEALQRNLEARESQLHEMESIMQSQRSEIVQKEQELEQVTRDLEALRASARGASVGYDANARVNDLESKLRKTAKELETKRATEKALNRSLKEAIGLLKPLQLHLEDAEKEKEELYAEIDELRKRVGDETKVRASPTETVGSEAVKRLEDTVRQLEKENTQLHDALEDMSHQLNISNVSGISISGLSQKDETKLRGELVELKSRYEVTQNRLEGAYVENHTLVEALTKREQETKAMAQEIALLRGELENAKTIATSALVKVEELTMANVTDQLSYNSGQRNGNDRNNVDRDLLVKEKARDFDREMRLARQQKGSKKLPAYRLT